ncbi:MAG: class I SAM-dependent methyltransferase, partial [Acetobacteraceae bacterium]
MDDLNPQSGERILDLGCGDGFLSQRIAERGARVVGVDASPEMIAAARARGIDARQLSAESLAFEAEFDGVFPMRPCT